MTEIALNTITILQPDDWHAHLRDGLALQRTVPDLAQQFSRAICMPNTVPPVKTVEEANAYRERIMATCTRRQCLRPTHGVVFY